MPANIFQLPNLRKLYLNGNPLIHKDLSKLAETTIRAPLELLDISNCKIKVLPEWGLLPQLMVYNISHNPLISLDVKYFPVMCNLAKIDITNSIENIRLCQLRPAILWFRDKQVYFQLGDYSTLNTRGKFNYKLKFASLFINTQLLINNLLFPEFDKCSNTYNADIYNKTFEMCKSEFLQVITLLF